MTELYQARKGNSEVEENLEKGAKEERARRSKYERII